MPLEYLFKRLFGSLEREKREGGRQGFPGDTVLRQRFRRRAGDGIEKMAKEGNVYSRYLSAGSGHRILTRDF